MELGNMVVEETPERAARSISAALDFLRVEADAAGLPEVGDLIQQAAAKAREHSAPLSPEALPASAAKLEDVCRAIVGLPDECREALVFRKVYRRSYEEIALDCSVPVDIAKARVIEGFQRLRASPTLRGTAGNR